MFKKQLGNSTDNKFINKKILLICILVVILVISFITLFATGTFSKLMGNSIDSYHCIDDSWKLEDGNCTRTTVKNVELYADINLDGKIDNEDLDVLKNYIDNRSTSDYEILNAIQKRLADLNEDKNIDESDINLLEYYINHLDEIKDKKVCENGYTLNGDSCELKEIMPAELEPVSVGSNNSDDTKVSFGFADFYKTNYSDVNIYSEKNLPKGAYDTIINQMKKLNKENVGYLQAVSNIILYNNKTYANQNGYSCGLSVVDLNSIYWRVADDCGGVDGDWIKGGFFHEVGHRIDNVSDQVTGTPLYKLKYNNQYIDYYAKKYENNKLCDGNYCLGYNGTYSYGDSYWELFADLFSLQEIGYKGTDELYNVMYEIKRKYSSVYEKHKDDIKQIQNKHSKLYAINFNANGAQGEMTAQILNYNIPSNIKYNQFSKDGHKFKGWKAKRADNKWLCYRDKLHLMLGWLEKDSCESFGYHLIENGESVSVLANPDSYVTLYPEWEPADTYTITYVMDEEKNDVIGTQKIPYGETVALKPFDNNKVAQSLSTKDDNIYDYINHFIGWHAKRSDGYGYCYTDINKSGEQWSDKDACLAYEYVLLKDNQNFYNNDTSQKNFTLVAQFDIKTNTNINSESSKTITLTYLDCETPDNSKVNSACVLLGTETYPASQFKKQLKASTKKDGYTFLWWRVKRSDNKWFCYTNYEKNKNDWVDKSVCDKYGYHVYLDKDVFYTHDMETVLMGYSRYNYEMYAQFEKSKFTLKFNAGGGTGSMPDQRIVYGLSTAISKNKFTKDGYIFQGWHAKRDDNKWYCYKNASKTSKDWVSESTCKQYGYYLYKDGLKVSNTANPNGYTTMYAQWKKNESVFKIKFNAGGGTGSMSDQNITYGVSTPIKANSYKKDGYKFIGWKAVRSDGMHYCYKNVAKTSTGWLKSNDCNGFGHSLYKDKQNVSKTAAPGTSVTMTAQWIENKFTVYYNANGGSGNSYNQRITYGVSTAMYANRYTKSGYNFQGWHAQRSNGTWYCYTDLTKHKLGWLKEKDCYDKYLYKDQLKISNTAEPGDYVIMNAQWKTNQFTVRYYAGGGTGSMPDQKITYGVLTSLSTNKFTRSEYKFIGWNAQRSDGDWYCYTNPAKTSVAWTNQSTCGSFGYYTYSNNQRVSKTAPAAGLVRMVAQWKYVPTKFTVRFYKDENSSNSYDQKITYGVSTKLTSNQFTKSGYTFIGWKAVRADESHYCYTNPAKTRTGWLNKSDCNGLGHSLYKNNQSVSKTTSAGRIVYMYAQWKKNR